MREANAAAIAITVAALRKIKTATKPSSTTSTKGFPSFTIEPPGPLRYMSQRILREKIASCNPASSGWCGTADASSKVFRRVSKFRAQRSNGFGT
jgi:hypothetical protein